MGRWWARCAVTVLLVPALAGCAAGDQTEAEMDPVAIESELEALDGVEEAHVGVFNTGAPGSFGLRTEVTLDDAGVERLGEVVVESLRAVRRGSSGYRAYQLLVSVVDPASPTGTRGLSLRRHRAEIPVEAGDYQGAGLVLTDRELTEAAGE